MTIFFYFMFHLVKIKAVCIQIKILMQEKKETAAKTFYFKFKVLYLKEINTNVDLLNI